MPDFTYEAITTAGVRSRGTLTANNERDAAAQLDAKGLFPVQIQAPRHAGPTANLRTGSKKVGARAMANFYSQLADLLHSGVPLLRSLDILQRQSAAPALAEVLKDVSLRVADGTSMADAMALHPRTFNELSVSMIKAGQEGGFLEDVLKRIADFTEQQEDLKSKVVGALAYPIFLACAGSAILFILVIFFVPQFRPIFSKLEEKGELPFVTVGLLNVSAFMISYWWLVIGLVVGTVVAFKSWAATDSGRLTLDRLRLKIPQAGTIYLNLALSRFTRILGTLMHNGIPILSALRIAKDSTGNKVLSEAIDKAADNVTGGKSLAGPLSVSKFFPRDVVEMVAVGEESNSLETVLTNIANGLEKRTMRQLELFVRLLEPMMLLVMAGVTLVIVTGLLLPVFKMSSTVQ